MSGSKLNTFLFLRRLPHVPLSPLFRRLSRFLNPPRPLLITLLFLFSFIPILMSHPLTHRRMHAGLLPILLPPPAALLSLHSARSMDTDQWHPGPLTSHTTSLPSLMQIRILATNLLSSECLFNGVGRWLLGGCAASQCQAFTPGTGCLTKEN